MKINDNEWFWAHEAEDIFNSTLFDQEKKKCWEVQWNMRVFQERWAKFDDDDDDDDCQFVRRSKRP